MRTGGSPAPRGRARERMAAVFALGVVAFLVPSFIQLFNRDILVAGIPLIYAYLFGAWILIIGLAALIARHSADQDTGRGPPGPDARQG